MFNYMTQLDGIHPTAERYFEASGHDPKSLLYNCLDEFLYVFCTELFVCKHVEVLSLTHGADGASGTIDAKFAGGTGSSSAATPQSTWRVRARGSAVLELTAIAATPECRLSNIAANFWRRVGEKFVSKAEGGQHEQGTEIKAITYSNMQVWEGTDKTELFVIVDI
eukprot:SAG31_NODE_5513_length_2485_cov_2.063286_6_plen_166_part_00